MSAVSALLYPSCYLKYKAAAASSLFLGQVFVLAPSEDSVGLITEAQEVGSMRISPLPAHPLGDKLEDFKNGLKALEAWGEQVGLGGDIGFETLYSALQNSENEDIQGIIGAIKGSKKEDILMASRFFLRLSMEADRRMDMLEQELERVEKDESRISELVGGIKAEGGKQAAGACFIEPLNRPRERLRAWARTFFTGGSAEECWPLGESIAVKDLMDSAYESLSGGGSPLDVVVFSLPPHPARLCREETASAVRPLFARLLEVLSGITGSELTGITGNDEVLSLIRDIQTAMETKCGAGSLEGGARMAVTVYPDHSWQEVLLKAAGLSDIEADMCPVAAMHGSIFLM